MPELPEIEHLKQTLTPWLVGSSVLSVNLRRVDILRNRDTEERRTRLAPRLLAGQRIERLRRYGKQLALLGSKGAAVVFHLGMSGHVRVLPNNLKLKGAAAAHVHCVWKVEGPKWSGTLIFRDPRRFGGLWAFESYKELFTSRWSKLGPDALTITAHKLRCTLADSRRPVKAALLDQSRIAGVGNIYADEALYLARIHPETPISRLDPPDAARLARSIRRVLNAAIECGGSTLRDYADANGEAGWFRTRHCVYGRGGQPCRRCGSPLLKTIAAQRTTVYCPTCQPPAPTLARSPARAIHKRRRAAMDVT